MPDEVVPDLCIGRIVRMFQCGHLIWLSVSYRTFRMGLPRRHTGSLGEPLRTGQDRIRRPCLFCGRATERGEVGLLALTFLYSHRVLVFSWTHLRSDTNAFIHGEKSRRMRQCFARAELERQRVCTHSSGYNCTRCRDSDVRTTVRIVVRLPDLDVASCLATVAQFLCDRLLELSPFADPR